MCALSIMLEKLAVERELSVVNTICHVRGRRRNAIQDLVCKHNKPFLALPDIKCFRECYRGRKIVYFSEEKIPNAGYILSDVTSPSILHNLLKLVTSFRK
jgi:hypothetical protein